MPPASLGRMEAGAQSLRVPREDRTMQAVHAGPLTGLFVQVLLLAALAETVGLSAGGWVVGLTCAVIMCSALARGLSRSRSAGLGAANWVTLARASLAVGVAALVADSFAHPAPVSAVGVNHRARTGARLRRRTGRATNENDRDVGRTLRR